MAEPISTVSFPELLQERWMPIIGRETFYSVSNLGRVRREWDGIGQRGRMLSPSLSHAGYPSVHLTKPTSNTYLVHRLVMEAFCGPCPKGQEVNHIDGDKANARLANLEYVTPRDNQLHAYRTGLRIPQERRGEFNPCHKLTAAKVIEIRRRRQNGEELKPLAAEFGVSIGTISRVALRGGWRHV